MDKIDPEKRFDGRWCWDSETGEKLLINMVTGQVIVRGRDLKDATHSSNEKQLLEEARLWEEGFNDGYSAAKKDYDPILWDLSDQIAWLREEQEYLLKLTKPSNGDIIQ
jgi:hypothetical protein